MTVKSPQKSPHVLLFSEATGWPTAEECSEAYDRRGGLQPQYWRFVLRSSDGDMNLNVIDKEEGVSAERLELLAVVRGLEALDQPSRVTLLTSTRSIQRGLRFGLDAWRDNGWQWERFGQMTPIKNADLWQRVDRALAFHDIDCRVVRLDPPTDDLTRSVPKSWASDTAHRPAAAAATRRSDGPLTGGLAMSLVTRLGQFRHAARELCSRSGLVPLMRAIAIRCWSSNCDAAICR